MTPVVLLHKFSLNGWTRLCGEECLLFKAASAVFCMADFSRLFMLTPLVLPLLNNCLRTQGSSKVLEKHFGAFWNLQLDDDIMFAAGALFKVAGLPQAAIHDVKCLLRMDYT